MLHKKSMLSKVITAQLLGLTVGGLALPTMAADTKQQAKEKDIEVITVKAQRRVQNIQDVPVAVTNISSAQLDENEMGDYIDVISLAPGINLEQGGEIRSSSISIRGIGSAQNNTGIEPSTSMLLDGEVLARSAAMNGDMTDIENVEVLRGPQGSLFGKNTSSGLVHFMTKRPDLERFSGYAKLSTDSYNLKKLQASITGPINDQFAFRLNAYTKDVDGHLENAHPDYEDIGKIDSSGVKGQLLYKPSEEFDLLVRVESSKKDSNCCGSVILSVNEEGAMNMFGGKGPAPIVGTQLGANNVTIIHPSNLDANGNSYTEIGPNATTTSADGRGQYGRIENKAANLEANYQFENSTLTYQAYTREWEVASNMDVDASPILSATSYFEGTNAADTTQHELRLASNGGENYDFVAGLFYMDMSLEREAEDRRCTTLNKWVAGGVDDPAYKPGKSTVISDDGIVLECAGPRDENYAKLPVGETGRYNVQADYATTVDTRNMALYGQFDYHFSDATTAFVGGRYLYEKTELYYKGGRGHQDLEFTNSASDKELIYRFGAQHRVNDDVMLYASYGTGYKGAGWFNSLAASAAELQDPNKNPVKPETSKAFELGARTDWLDDTLRINMTAFHINYEGFQERVSRNLPQFDGEGLPIYETDEDGNPTTNQKYAWSGIFANAGDVRTQGLELESTWNATEDLRFDMTAAYIDAIYEDFSGSSIRCPAELLDTASCSQRDPENIDPKNPNKTSIINLDGMTLPKAPKWQTRISARYDLEVMDQAAFVTMAYRWKDEMQFRSNMDPNTVHPSYGIADLNFGMKGEVGDYDYKFNLFVKNMFDKTYYTRITPRSNNFGGGYRGVVARDFQRYFGASFTLSF